ncbi:inositol 1,4,5-trisphosphate receptor-interacting protein-like 1 [Grus japonensis]|uniref:Inositol 1,4,5-trisphosphate receptor-interacting protein-like 1 n=1 Tax=Grus japonensis TaxID=30415 RepID=A0ABC9WTP8_GRUJA
MKLASGSCSEQDSFSSEEQEEDNEQEEKDLSDARNIVRSLAVSTPSPTQGLPDTCKVLKELVSDLLGVCRMLCKRAFMLQLYPAIGMDGTYEAWSVHKSSMVCYLLVFLQQPPGHSFSLELDLVPPTHPLHMLLLGCGENRGLGPAAGETIPAASASVAPLPAASAALPPVLQGPADEPLQNEDLH